MADLTVKQKEFCRLMAEGKCKDQSDAYRKAFKPKKSKASWIRVRASELMAKSNIQVTIKKLSEPIDLDVLRTRQEYLLLGEALTFHDPGKMYDEFGNALEPKDMEFAERMSIEGHEFKEDYLDSKDKNGNKSKTACGYTKKFKHTDRHKWFVTTGKMRGFISDDPPAIDLSNLSINVAFVNSSGDLVNIGEIVGPAKSTDPPIRTIQPQVSFVR